MIKILDCFIFILSFCLCFFSCEKTITEGEMPYKEEIVVRGILEAGEPVKNIYVTITLPPLNYKQYGSPVISDADVYIESDGKKYLLNSIGKGYYGNDSLIAQPGKEYNLNVNWNGKNVKSTTTVPYPVDPEDVIFRLENLYNNFNVWMIQIEILIKPLQYFAYTAAIGRCQNNVLIDKSYGENVYQIGDTLSDGKIKMTMHSDQIFEDSVEIKNIFKKFIADHVAVVEAYDRQFYKYYLTRLNGKPAEGINLLDPTDNIVWNVYGDGFGLFIGRAVSFKKLSNYQKIK